MLLKSLLVVYDVPVTPLWSITVVENAALVDTWTRYDAAPAEAFQRNVGVVETSVAPLDGETSAGDEGIETIVVKFRTPDQSLVPPALVALTRQ